MMGKVFVVNGWGGVGKGEFVSACREYSDGPIHIRSMVATTKRTAFLCGWDGNKDDAGRELISSIKAATDKYYPEFLALSMVELVNAFDCSTCSTFIDARETKDIEELKHRLNAKTILITNDRIECPNCKSDKAIKLTGYDYVVENNGTLEDLEMKAGEFMKEVS